MTTNFFSPLSFVAVFGSGIRDPGSEIRDPGSKIRDPGWVKIGIRDIPDPRHCKKGAFNRMGERLLMKQGGLCSISSLIFVF